MTHTQKSSKRLVMVGIRRKGEKGFKTRIREDVQVSLPMTADLKKEVDPILEENSSR